MNAVPSGSRHARRLSDVRQAFTLLELLVLLAIIAVALGLLLSAVQSVRATAARAACANNLRQLALASHAYEVSHDELPQGCSLPLESPHPFWVGSLSANWLMALLPHADQQATFSLIEEGKRLPSAEYRAFNDRMRGVVVKAYLCPAGGMPLGVERHNGHVGFGLTNYLGSSGTGRHADDGMFHFALSVRMTDVRDGASNTLLIGERPPGPFGDDAAWYLGEGATLNPYATLMPADDYYYNFPDKGCPGPDAPGAGPLRPGRLDSPCDRSHYWSLHPRGANFAFADGSVRFLPYTASHLIPALSTRAGGESVRLD